jgi:hypothetical protein
MLPSKIRFGTPKKNCQGHGICEIDHWEKAPEQPTTQCTPIKTFWLLSDEGVLGLMIPSGLAPKILDQHFAGSFFKMEEPILLPKFLQKHFNLPESYLIPAGHYQIIRSPYMFFIYFKEHVTF